MKILRITFENLNSLPSGDIDLENGPLSRAGIFAITGPTGSGKSTILDAITLALYGRAARYEKAPNPEHMMSRHTGQCQAEVVFEVPSGRYRAQWTLRRARGRAEGKLQAPTRRIFDSEGKTLAQNISEADREIVALTGLDYERFLRSALLAQGQFARFLKASESERADLLESLTSTAVYSQLSELAYREATDRQNALEGQRQRIGEIAILPPEAVAEKTAGIARLEAETARLQAERDTVGKRLDLGRQSARLHEEEAALATREGSHQAECREHAASLQELERHRQAQPFAEAVRGLDEAQARLQAQTAQLHEALKAEREATDTLSHAVAAARETVEAAITAAEGALAREKALLEQTAAEQEENTRWLEAHAPDAGLESTLSPQVESLTRLAATRKAAAEAAKEQGTLLERKQALSNTLTQRLKEEETATRAAKATAQSDEAARSTLHTLLAGRSADDLFNHYTTLETRRIALKKLEEIIERRDAMAAEALALSDDEARLSDELEAARIQKAATESEAQAQAALLEQARTALEQLERIASYEEARSHLVDGKPCPLCGSPKHPFATPERPVSREIEEARRHLATARAADATARKEAELATADLARTQEALVQLHRQRGALRSEQMASHEAFETSARPLRIYTVESLNEALEANRRATEAHGKLIDDYRKAENARGQAELAHEKARQELARCADAVAATRGQLQECEADLAARQERLTHLAAEEAELAAPLAALLTGLGLALPASGEEPGVIATLQAREKAYRSRVEQRLTLENKHTRLRLTIAEAEKQIETLREQAAGLRVDASARLSRPGIAALRREWATVQHGLDAVETLRQAEARAQATSAERRRQMEEQEQRLAAEEAAVCARLAASPFGTLEAWRAARLEDGEAQRREALHQRLERERESLAALRQQLARQREKLASETAPESDALPALLQEHKRLEAAILATVSERTTLRHELDQNERQRSLQAERLREYETAKAELTTWLSLRDLIGSADGRKFSRFAQGLSLDLLLRRANRHLQRFNGRYTLRRAGAGELEIIDQHQAEAVRPVSSLSGGESFLVSLALALGLSDLAGHNVRIDSLFIDEGFGALDSESLDTAIAALDTLRLSEKTIGIISHVEMLKERIPVQIRVERQPGGLGLLRLPAAG